MNTMKKKRKHRRKRRRKISQRGSAALPPILPDIPATTAFALFKDECKVCLTRAPDDDRLPLSLQLIVPCKTIQSHNVSLVIFPPSLIEVGGKGKPVYKSEIKVTKRITGRITGRITSYDIVNQPLVDLQTETGFFSSPEKVTVNGIMTKFGAPEDTEVAVSPAKRSRETPDKLFITIQLMGKDRSLKKITLEVDLDEYVHIKEGIIRPSQITHTQREVIQKSIMPHPGPVSEETGSGGAVAGSAAYASSDAATAPPTKDEEDFIVKCFWKQALHDLFTQLSGPYIDSVDRYGEAMEKKAVEEQKRVQQAQLREKERLCALAGHPPARRQNWGVQQVNLEMRCNCGIINLTTTVSVPPQGILRCTPVEVCVNSWFEEMEEEIRISKGAFNASKILSLMLPTTEGGGWLDDDTIAKLIAANHNEATVQSPTTTEILRETVRNARKELHGAKGLLHENYGEFFNLNGNTFLSRLIGTMSVLDYSEEFVRPRYILDREFFEKYMNMWAIATHHCRQLRATHADLIISDSVLPDLHQRADKYGVKSILGSIPELKQEKNEKLSGLTGIEITQDDASLSQILTDEISILRCMEYLFDPDPDPDSESLKKLYETLIEHMQIYKPVGGVEGRLEGWRTLLDLQKRIGAKIAKIKITISETPEKPANPGEYLYRIYKTCLDVE